MAKILNKGGSPNMGSRSTKMLKCTHCTEEEKVDIDSVAVTCWRCVSKLTSTPISNRKKK